MFLKKSLTNAVSVVMNIAKKEIWKHTLRASRGQIGHNMVSSDPKGSQGAQQGLKGPNEASRDPKEPSRILPRKATLDLSSRNPKKEGTVKKRQERGSKGMKRSFHYSSVEVGQCQRKCKSGAKSSIDHFSKCILTDPDIFEEREEIQCNINAMWMCPPMVNTTKFALCFGVRSIDHFDAQN